MKFKIAMVFCVLLIEMFWLQSPNGSLYAQQLINKDSPEVKALIEECRAAIQTEMKKTNTPGLSIAIIWDGKQLWTENFGSTDGTGKKKVTNETIFAIQSLSKQITAVAILTAVQDGILDLDAPISIYLPGFSLNSRFEERPQDKITLRLLLSHRAGFAHNLADIDSAEARERSLEQHVREIAKTELIHPVGEQFSYSNIGFDLAGYILQKISGEPFGQYVGRKVFKPLAMDNSFMIATEIKNHENRAVGNIKDIQLSGEIPLFPSLGVFCTIEDMAKFVQFNLNGGKVNGKTILKHDILQQMYAVPFDTSGKNEGYALGIAVYHRRHNGDIVPICVHSGDGYGFSADIFYAPESGLGTLILTNQNNFNMRWRGDLEDMIYRHLGNRLEFF